MTSIRRFGLEGLIFVGFVVVADVNDDGPVRGLDSVEFVVTSFWVVVRTGRDFGEVLPRLSIITRFPCANLFAFSPEFLPWVEESSVTKLDGAVRAVRGAALSRFP